MNNKSIVVLVTYRVQAGKKDAAIREISSLIDTVRSTEIDCHGITMLQDVDDPTRILLHELWPDKDSFLGPHSQTPHLQAFRKRAPELFEGPPELSFWSVTREAASSVL